MSVRSHPARTTSREFRDWAAHFRLPSVRHHLIVRARQRTVTHHRREGGAGIATRTVGTGRLELGPPGVTVEMSDLFA